jgi:DNA-binding response OmpR family regulator
MAKILVVDDEKDVVFLIKFILEQSGYSVSTAFNGQEALAALGVEPANPSLPLPDLVLLDVMMPIMDGHTVSVKMREDQRTNRLPIIIVTARADMRHLFEGAPNVAGYMQKPFDPKRLREQVDSLVPKPGQA